MEKYHEILTATDHILVKIEAAVLAEAKTLVSQLCRHFYTVGWVSGTGGGVTVRVHQDNVPRHQQLIVMPPSGVEKERMEAEDMYVLSSDGFILSRPSPKPYPHRPPKYTDCASLFLKIYEMRNAGAIIHSHGIEPCLVTLIDPSLKEFRLRNMEMIKGIQGHGYDDELVVPIIENTAHEGELTESLAEAVRAYPKSTAVLVRNHGVYIWGETWISAKTQAECYHYLFDAALRVHQLGLRRYLSDRCDLVNHLKKGDCRHCGKSLSFQAADQVSVGNTNLSHPRFVLLDVRGTTTPESYIKNILVKYLAAANHGDKMQDDVSLLCSEIQRTSLEDNMEPRTSTRSEVSACKQSQGQILNRGLQSKDPEGMVYNDVPEVLKRWHFSGIKVYIFSDLSREVQQLLFAKSKFGDLRTYISGFFDTTIGSKVEVRSYIEILHTVGVEKAADMLFVTADIQDALTSKAAGMEAIVCVRPGAGSSGPCSDSHLFRTVESLLQI